MPSNWGSRKLALQIVIVSIVIFIFIKIMFNTLFIEQLLYPSNQTLLRPPTSYPYIAVLVEFRSIDMMITVVHNVYHHIPSSWPIQIFHGQTNRDFILNSTLAPLIHSGKILLSSMSVYGKERTNELLTDPKFWDQVRGEKILFFQIDSIMCSNSPHKITDYLSYDYIGAPWDPSSFLFSKVNFVGNGGFSLRSRSKILSLLKLLHYDGKQPEDVWYSMNLYRVNATIAPVNVAKTFAVETVYYERPLAVHRSTINCWVRSKLTQTCPETMMIMSNNCK
jgi:hypothetical protein